MYNWIAAICQFTCDSNIAIDIFPSLIVLLEMMESFSMQYHCLWHDYINITYVHVCTHTNLSTKFFVEMLLANIQVLRGNKKHKNKHTQKLSVLFAYRKTHVIESSLYNK